MYSPCFVVVSAPITLHENAWIFLSSHRKVATWVNIMKGKKQRIVFKNAMINLAKRRLHP